MPKMKSKRGAVKRFRVRGSGSIKRGGAYKRHILTKKSTKRKRQMRRRSAPCQESSVESRRAPATRRS